MSAHLLADAEIRPILRSLLVSSHLDQPDTVLLDEVGICRGQVRIDLAMVNGTIHGYEIKSDRDSLRRLGGQIDLCGRVLDRATLVVGARHLTDAIAMLPFWWGVLRVETTRSGARLKTVRKGRWNPQRDARALVELLWLEDAMALLTRHKLDRGMKGKPRGVVWDHVCSNLEIEVIAAAVRTNLKARVKSLADLQPQPCGG